MKKFILCFIFFESETDLVFMTHIHVLPGTGNVIENTVNLLFKKEHDMIYYQKLVFDTCILTATTIQ